MTKISCYSSFFIMEQDRCEYCNEPVIPLNEENATYMVKCQHLYHQRCLAAMMRDQPERNSRNQVIMPCINPHCSQRLSMSDVAIIQQPVGNNLPNLQGNDHELNHRDDQIALFAHRMALMKMENREIKARYNLAIQRQHISTELCTERNPATLYKPQSNITDDFVPVNANRYPAPKFPSYFPVQIHSTFHIEHTSDGRPLFVHSTRFQPQPIITEIDNRARTISYRRYTTNIPNIDLRDKLTNNHFSSMATNNINGNARTRPTNHRSSSTNVNSYYCYNTRNALQTPKEPRFPMKGPSPKPKTEIDPKTGMPKQVKGTSADKGDYHQRYWKRWHTHSSEIQPFYPLNSYPKYFTAAGYAHGPNIFRSVYFTFNILMIGDGHMQAIANILEQRRPFAGILDTDMYRRDLLLANITEYLGSWEVLPARIMIAIGHADILRRTAEDEIKETLRMLGIILNNANVREAYLVPLIPHSSFDSQIFDRFSLALEHHWVENFDGVTIKIDGMFADLHSRPAHFDEFGPYYDDADYLPIIAALKERFIPELKKKVKDPTPIEGIEQEDTMQSIVNQFQNSQSQPSSSRNTEENTDQPSSMSAINPSPETTNASTPSTLYCIEQQSSTSTVNSAASSSMIISMVPPPVENMETNENVEITMTESLNGKEILSSMATPIKIRRRNAAIISIKKAHTQLTNKKLTDKRKLEQEQVETKIAKLTAVTRLRTDGLK